ncbi:alpha/beta fold hydrolase [Pseudohoeflea coraliihabitans]|uniref:Alpha/beta hydrolase n=1 Tax=Pseudohoeflea coraliihabitans TaxID=2860393 RepID=A0ABS6WIB4_9HYPH|nr:alpha/beta hydrolase [Pseudohoeflea sp. DP4N28-3]MBW3095689.1 alpha/beta hydrolase [Pseudohoeflea sp. DP4N28-3]
MTMKPDFQTIHSAGVDLNVAIFGEGPAVVCLHGFPDSWFLWRHQVDALVSAGYRVIALDQRGFGASSKPVEVEAYAIDLLVGDVVAVMDSLDLENAHVLCHDWGANVGWYLAHRHPERVNRFIPVGSGHPIFSRTIEGMEKAWYILLFQFEGVAEEMMARDNFSLFRQLVRHHDECGKWIEDLSRPNALRAAMNWYRANYSPQNGLVMPSVGSIQSATMGVFGLDDVFLQEMRMIGSKNAVEGFWRYERVTGAGHWVQLDRPGYFNALLLDFLRQDLPEAKGSAGPGT